MKTPSRIPLYICLAFGSWAVHAAPWTFTDAVIAVPRDASDGLRLAGTVLAEEIAARTGLEWPITEAPVTGRPSVALWLGDAPPDWPLPPGLHDRVIALPAEGFVIETDTRDGDAPVLWLGVNDRRGALYAVGEVLRTLAWSSGNAELPSAIHVTATPSDRIRGHQIGFRNRANSWDAWTYAQIDQHFRELALNGDNCVENIPFQDTAGPLALYPRDELNVEFGRICDKYDLDHWVWVPVEFDLNDTDQAADFLDEQEAFYQAATRLDAIFVPGGDPGANHPHLVLAYMEAMGERARRHHPDVELWISLQGFRPPWVDDFYTWIAEHEPVWLTGVVAGPSSPAIPETRQRLPENYGLRRYPDITHTTRCQYPVPWWDPAFALTQGREVSNPRPIFYTEIYTRFAPYTDGFLTYSDGVHDDVNKMIWSRLAWNPQARPRDILIDYARMYFGFEAAERAADGILALERNWDGPIDENGSIEATLALWQSLEAEFPERAGNWRWQLCLVRAYYDAYIRHRVMYEEALEREAMAVLRDTEDADAAMDRALAIVQRADTEPVRGDLRQRVVDLCEDLWQSIRLQTSIEKYQASEPERGVILDFLDYPLNNRWWLEDRFAELRPMDDAAKRAALDIIATWDDPGPGSFYDDAGRVGRSPRMVERPQPGQAWWDNGMSRARLSWQVYMDDPLKLRYTGLDPDANYLFRIAGYRDAIVRMNGTLVDPVTFDPELGGFKEYSVPSEYIRDGELEVTWERPDERALNWRQYSRLSDVWLLLLD